MPHTRPTEHEGGQGSGLVFYLGRSGYFPVSLHHAYSPWHNLKRLPLHKGAFNIAQGTVLCVNWHKKSSDPLNRKNDPRGLQRFKIRVLTQKTPLALQAVFSTKSTLTGG